MMRRIAPVILAVLVFSVAITATANAEKPAPRSVWLLGDSITKGYQTTFAWQNKHWQVTGLGLGFERSSGGLCRARGYFGLVSTPDICEPAGNVFWPWAAPDAVVILYGANDIMYHLNHGGSADDPGVAERLVANLRALRDLFAERGTEVVIALPFSRRDRRVRIGYRAENVDYAQRYWQMQDGIRAALLAQEFRLVDFTAPDARYFEDGPEYPGFVHPSSRGVVLLARRAAKQVGRALKHRPRLQLAG